MDVEKLCWIDTLKVTHVYRYSKLYLPIISKHHLSIWTVIWIIPKFSYVLSAFDCGLSPTTRASHHYQENWDPSYKLWILFFYIRTYYVCPPLYNAKIVILLNYIDSLNFVIIRVNKSRSNDETLITVDVLIETTNNNLT